MGWEHGGTPTDFFRKELASSRERSPAAELRACALSRSKHGQWRGRVRGTDIPSAPLWSPTTEGLGPDPQRWTKSSEENITTIPDSQPQ